MGAATHPLIVQNPVLFSQSGLRMSRVSLVVYTGEFLAEAGVVAAAPKAKRGRGRKVPPAA